MVRPVSACCFPLPIPVFPAGVRCSSQASAVATQCLQKSPLLPHRTIAIVTDAIACIPQHHPVWVGSIDRSRDSAFYCLQIADMSPMEIALTAAIGARPCPTTDTVRCQYFGKRHPSLPARFVIRILLLYSFRAPSLSLPISSNRPVSPNSVAHLDITPAS